MTPQLDSLAGFLILAAASLIAVFIAAAIELGNTFTRRQP